MRARILDANQMGAFTHTRTVVDGPALPKYGGKTAAEIDAFVVDLSDRRETTQTCALCDWEGFSGSAADARAAGIEHRTVAHPETFRKLKLKAGYGLTTKPLARASDEVQQAARLRGSLAAREAA